MSANYGTTKYASNKQEKRVARVFNGRIRIASGALDDKGDVITDDILFECKTTRKRQYVLKADTWLKIYNEAKKIRKCPVLYIDLADYCCSVKKTGLVILRRADFDYYNVKSGLNIHPTNNKKFNKQTTIYDGDTHTVLSSPLIDEELVILNSRLFCEMVKE